MTWAEFRGSMASLFSLPGLAKFARVTIGSLLGLASAAAILLAIVWTLTLAVRWSPNEVVEKLSDLISGDTYFTNRAPLDTHSAISAWALQCVGANSISDIPLALRTLFDIQYGPRGIFVLPAASTGKKIELSQINAVQLSRSIALQRLQLDQKVATSYGSLQYLQWTIIIIGLITTVVVSISSAELFGKSDTSSGKTIRVLAIILPAFGTAVAAVNSFYNPRDEWNKASNAVAGLSQLHGEMAIDIWAVGCGDEADKSGKLTTKVADWTKRYNDIITVASGSVSNKSPNTNQGNQPAPGGTP